MAVLTAFSIAPAVVVARGVQSTDPNCRRTAAPRAFVEPPFLRLARAVWNGQKTKQQARGATALATVSVAAAAAAEEATVPTVSTETVPLPKKVGKGVVRLRLTRLGRKKRPFFRLVATHSSWRRDGKYIELLGHYNPLHAKDDLGIVVKADRIKYWLGVGAQPSDTVTGILHKVGILKKVPQES